MMERHVPATRSNLARVRRRLDQVQKGTDLLKRKREALIAELMRQAHPAVGVRQAVESEAAAAYLALLEALAVHGGAGIRTMGWPSREVAVDIDVAQVWGVAVPAIGERPVLVRTVPARGTAPALVGPAAAAAAQRFERLIELLLDTVPQDATMRRVGAALSSTTRQVNTLQQRVAPGLEGRLHEITETLLERERDENVRLRHLVRHRRVSPPQRPWT